MSWIPFHYLDSFPLTQAPQKASIRISSNSTSFSPCLKMMQVFITTTQLLRQAPYFFSSHPNTIQTLPWHNLSLIYAHFMSHYIIETSSIILCLFPHRIGLFSYQTHPYLSPNIPNVPFEFKHTKMSHPYIHGPDLTSLKPFPRQTAPKRLVYSNQIKSNLLLTSRDWSRPRWGWFEATPTFSRPCQRSYLNQPLQQLFFLHFRIVFVHFFT